MANDKFHPVSLVERLDLPANANDWSDADLKTSIMAGYIESAMFDMEPINAVIAEEVEKIREAQANVERMDTWFGRITGQHRWAQVSLEVLQEERGGLLDDARSTKERMMSDLAEKMQNGLGSHSAPPVSEITFIDPDANDSASPA